jgi:aryl-alcohol dehydrogenase-like predicted oxidoreductase
VGSIVDALNEHLAAGRIHAFGGSNWTRARIAEANAYAAAHGLVGFAASSPNYGLAEQVEDPWGPGCVSLSGPVARSARRWYEESQMPVLAYSSLARGFLSGRVTRDTFDEVRGTLDGACLKAYCHEVNFRRLDRAIQLAAEKGVSVPQIATAFVLGSSMDVFPLVGAASGEEFADTVRAFEVRLTPWERAWLDLERDER